MDGAMEGRGDEGVAYPGLQSAGQLLSKGRLEVGVDNIAKTGKRTGFIGLSKIGWVKFKFLKFLSNF
jgi:hypothetical protein